jgi:translation initiation factor IF-1
VSLTIRHKHSSVLNRAPLASDLSDGELALNINAGSPAVYLKDSAGQVIKIADGSTGGGGGAQNLNDLNDVDTATTSPVAGNVLSYNGTNWVPSAGGGGGGITTINGTLPAVVTGTGTTRTVAVNDGSTTAKGAVQLADTAAVTAGTAGRVVTADQLKTTNDVVAGHTTSITNNTTNITTIQGQITTLQGQVVDATTAVKGVVRLADGAAITAGTAGRAVTADQLKTTNDTVAGHTTSITTIQGQVTTINGKVVDATTAVKGIVQLADNAAVAAGTAGLVVTADQLKATNDAITTATGGGLTGLNGTVPITVSGTGAVRTVGVSDASTAATGVVRLADAAAVTAGTAGRVVTADQLKTTNDVVAGHTTSITTLNGKTVDATTAIKGIVQLADGAAITAGTAGRAVTADQLKTTNDTVAGHTTSIANNTTNITTIQGQITTLQGQVVDATTAAKGVVRLADAAAVTAGTAGRAVTADQLKTTNDAVTANTTSIANNTTNITTIQGQITTINGKVVDASTTAKGIVQLATAAEVTTGTDALKAVTPATAKVELDKKAPLASPTFTGVPSGPTAAAGTNTTQLATTAFAQTYFLAKDISKLPLLP